MNSLLRAEEIFARKSWTEVVWHCHFPDPLFAWHDFFISGANLCKLYNKVLILFCEDIKRQLVLAMTNWTAQVYIINHLTIPSLCCCRRRWFSLFTTLPMNDVSPTLPSAYLSLIYTPPLPLPRDSSHPRGLVCPGHPLSHINKLTDLINYTQWTNIISFSSIYIYITLWLCRWWCCSSHWQSKCFLFVINWVSRSTFAYVEAHR